MSGDSDEMVGSDQLTNTLTAPSQKRTLQDYWNIAYRGFLPAGMNRNGESGAPSLPNGGPDAEPFSETPKTVVEVDEPADIRTTPVALIADHTRDRTQTFFRAYQVAVGPTGTTQIVNADPRRRRVVFVNAGPGRIYLGDTESVGLTGYVMPASEITDKELITTRRVWAQQESGQASAAIVHVIVEYEKEV